MAVKRKFAVKTLAEKCQALRDLQNGISNKNVEEKYGELKNTVSTWLQNKEKLITKLKKSLTKRKKAKESNYPDIDNVVPKCFLSQRGKSIPIDGTFIKEKAMNFLHLVYISISIYLFYQQVYKCCFSISMHFSIPVKINLQKLTCMHALACLRHHPNSPAFP